MQGNPQMQDQKVVNIYESQCAHVHLATIEAKIILDLAKVSMGS